MSKRLIVKVFSPILTFMMALVLITTTLAWYTFVLDTEPAEASVSITATVNDGRDGYDAELLPISDSYSITTIKEAGNTYDEYQVVYDTKVDPVGYCGQTGLPDVDTVYDIPYIYFVKVTITSPIGDYKLIDMAYVNGAKIYWEKNENSTFDQTLKSNLGSYVEEKYINYFDDEDNVVAEYDDASRLEISLEPTYDDEGNATKPNELTYNQFKIMMLEKRVANKVVVNEGTQDQRENINYTFVPSSQMMIDEVGEDGSYVYYIGVKFHNGTNNRFAFSDTIFTGCKFSLDLKFVSSQNNDYIVLEKNGNQNDLIAPKGSTNNTNSSGLTDWLSKRTYVIEDAKAGDEFRIYNTLNENYISGYTNFDSTTVLTKDGVEYFKVPANGDYEVIVTSYRDKYEILVKNDVSVSFVYQGDTNSWTKEKMTLVSDSSTINSVVASTLANANANKYSSTQNRWYKDHLTGFTASEYNVYKMSNVTSNKIFKFNLMSSNMDVYQNGQSDYIQIAPGKYDIYCIVPKAVDNGRVTDSQYVTVIYNKTGTVTEQEQSWWVKCTTNSWTGNDNYKFTKMPASVKAATSYTAGKTYYTVKQVTPSEVKEESLRYYYVSNGGALYLNNDRTQDTKHTYYTVSEVYGMSQASFNQAAAGTYYEALNEKANLTPYYTFANHDKYIEGYSYYDRVDGGAYVQTNGSYYYQDGVTDGFNFVQVFPKEGNDVSTYYVRALEINSEHESSNTINNASVFFTCSSAGLSYINLSTGEQCNIGNADNSITFGLTSLDPITTNTKGATGKCYFVKGTNEARMVNENNHSYAFMFYYYQTINADTNEASTYGYLGVVGVK